MKRQIKSLIAACIAVCMIVCIGIFATACDNTDKDHYVVTVQDEDGNGIANVGVQICANDGALTACLMDVYTDANGVSTVDISECVGATNFTIHLNGVPAGYIFEAGDQGVTVFVKDGYSTTITLKKGSANVPTPDIQNFNIKLASASSTQSIAPVIEEAGFYSLRSINAFTISGTGFALNNGYNSVLIYLEPEAVLNIGTASNETEFSCALLKPSSSTTDGNTKPHVVSEGSAIVFNLGANENAAFINPTIQNNREGSHAVISGTNFKATIQGKSYTETFVAAIGAEFSVSTADGKAGLVALEFSAPDNTVNLSIGQSTDFSVMLLTQNSSLRWISETFYLTFTVKETGFYKISLSSAFESDLISITQTGSNIHYPDAKEHSQVAGKDYYAVYELRAGETYKAYVSSSVTNYLTFNNSASEGNMFKEGDTIKYTALVEKIEN
ncbi:MAG: Ig-like domain-containing protein [Clostridia bacterium]|nr:Ig-like domain-containing protein [Clostridia bacterium]